MNESDLATFVTLTGGQTIKVSLHAIVFKWKSLSACLPLSLLAKPARYYCAPAPTVVVAECSEPHRIHPAAKADYSAPSGTAKRGDIVDFPKIAGSMKLDCKVQLVHSSIAIMPLWPQAGSSAEPIPNL